MSRPSAGRIDDIEVLRALAIVLVLIQHLPNLFPWLGGHFPWNGMVTFAVGVDLFFAISGYVIARSLLPDMLRASEEGRLSPVILAFVIRRAWRLWPAAWFWLILMLVCVGLFNQTGVFGSLRANLEATVAGFLHVANFRMVETFMLREYGVSFVYWSLSTEEQFYLALPLLALLFRRWLWAVLMAFVFYRFIEGQMASVFRFEVIAIGVLIAMAMERPLTSLFEPGFMKSRLVALAILIFALGSLVVLGGRENRIGVPGQPLITILCAALVFAAAWNRDFFRMPGVLHQTMLWIGSRSYALYLAHIPVYRGCTEIWFRLFGKMPTPEDIWIMAALACALLLILVELTWRCIEVPLRAHGARISERMLKPADAATAGQEAR